MAIGAGTSFLVNESILGLERTEIMKRQICMIVRDNSPAPNVIEFRIVPFRRLTRLEIRG